MFTYKFCRHICSQFSFFTGTSQKVNNKTTAFFNLRNLNKVRAHHSRLNKICAKNYKWRSFVQRLNIVCLLYRSHSWWAFDARKILAETRPKIWKNRFRRLWVLFALMFLKCFVLSGLLKILDRRNLYKWAVVCFRDKQDMISHWCIPAWYTWVSNQTEFESVLKEDTLNDQ